jgi:hypothetical protein
VETRRVPKLSPGCSASASRGDYRVTTWITPVRPESKRIVRELMGGDEEAMLPESAQMSSGVLR